MSRGSRRSRLRSWIRRGGGRVASTGSFVQMFSSERRAARAQFERKGKNFSGTWTKTAAEGDCSQGLSAAMQGESPFFGVGVLPSTQVCCLNWMLLTPSKPYLAALGSPATLHPHCPGCGQAGKSVRSLWGRAGSTTLS